MAGADGTVQQSVGQQPASESPAVPADGGAGEVQGGAATSGVAPMQPMGPASSVEATSTQAGTPGPASGLLLVWLLPLRRCCYKMACGW